METILEIHNLQMSFPFSHKKRDLQSRLIRGAELLIHRNRISALIGGNGVGKTTMFNLINGFLTPDEGQIIYYPDRKAISLNNRSPYQVARLGIGRLFQGSRTFDGLSLRECLMIAANERAMEKPFYPLFAPRQLRRKKALLDKKIHALLHDVGDHRFIKNLDLPVRNLSYAQQRILNMISLLMGDYRMVLLDEPCSGISPDDWDTVGQIMLEMQSRGITLLLIEHNLDFIRKYIQDCHYMSSGRIVCSGPTAAVLEMPEVREEYLALC